MVTARSLNRVLLIACILTIIFSTISLTAQNPVGIWKLDEGSGDLAYDSSGGGRTATLSSGIQWSKSTSTWTVSSDGLHRGYVTTPALDLSGSNAVSVTFWLEHSFSTTNGQSVLFEAGKNYLQSQTGFALLVDNDTCHGLQAVLRGNEGTTANCYAQPSTGGWHHLTVVYDKSGTGGNAVSLYVDGALQIPTWNLSSATNTNNFGNEPIYLLSRAGASQFSSGTLSDFRVYDGVLSGDQIQQIYNDKLQESPATITYVQGNYADPQASHSSVFVPYTAAQSAGNLNLVVVAWEDSTATVRQITDSKGNTYTRAVGPTVISGVASQSIYYAKNIASAAAGSNSVTVTFSSSAKNPDVRILEYSGADTSSPIDVTAASSGNGRTCSSGSANTTNATDLILGADVALALTTGPGTGFTKRVLTSPQGNIVEDQSVTATGAYSATAPLMPTGRWIMQMVAVRHRPPTLTSISVTPASASVAVGAHQQFTATGNYSDGSHQDLTNSATWTSSSPSIATISTGGLATGVAAGTTTIKAASGSIHGTASLTVTNAGTFSISASPGSLNIPQGTQGGSTITTVVSNGFNSSIALSASGAPSGTTVSFNPTTIAAPGSGSSSMTVTVGSSTPAGTYPITVAANGGGVEQSTTVTVTVTASSSFTISASPAAITVVQGHAGTSTLTTTGLNGFNSSISLSASGTPTGTTISFSPNPIPAPGSGNSTMTVTVGASTPAGTYPITVNANGGGIPQAATVTLTVIAAAGGISLDGNVHGVRDNGGSTSTTAALNLGTPSTGDLITCEVTFDGHNNNSLLSLSDNVNGSYVAAVPAHLNSTLIQWFGIYYKENVGGSPTTVTVTTSQSEPWLAVSCQAWKGAASSGSLDTAFQQSQDVLSTPNPITGANKTPMGNGELVIAGAGLYSGGAPTAGANYTLMDDAPATQWWPEYWIQTTAAPTAGNFTWQTDNWTDMMAAFRPASTGTFTLSASPASLSVAQANQGTSTLTTAVSGGFNSPITLSASGVPSGTTVGFNPSTFPAPGSGNSVMTISVGANTPVGTYPIAIAANGGGIQETTTVTLTVTAGSGFSISSSPASLSVMQGMQGASTITTTVSGGFDNSISLAASGAPTGVSVTFSPATIPAPGGGNSVMTINVGGSTRIGSYPITITGTAGTLHQTTTVTLTVTAQVALSWSASQSPGIAGYNIYRSMTSGGPYTKINSTLNAGTSYNDQAVQDGYTYYYVTTAVTTQGMESGYSNQASGSIP
jgi:uncharacterized membrane protein